MKHDNEANVNPISLTSELSLNRLLKYGGCTLIRGFFKLPSNLYFVLDCESKRLILRQLNAVAQPWPVSVK